MSTSLKNSNDDEPPDQMSLARRAVAAFFINFYKDHRTASHIAIGALFAAVLAASLHASPDLVVSFAGTGMTAGFFMASLQEGAVIAVGALVGTMVAWLAGLHGEAALSLTTTGTVLGFFLRQKPEEENHG